MRVLVTGGRTYEEWRTISRVLRDLHAETPIELVIVGGAPGADRLAQKWAETQHIPVCVFPPNWHHMGKRAGPVRNASMLRFANPDVIVAFPGGSGTADMVRQAQAAGERVIDLRRSEAPTETTGAEH